MQEDTDRHVKTLDLARIGRLGYAAAYVSRTPVGMGIALVFMALTGLAAALFFWTVTLELCDRRGSGPSWCLRLHFMTIVAVWVITVPATAAMSGGFSRS